jgi:hypothetical protein
MNEDQVLNEIKSLLSKCTVEQRMFLFKELRHEFGIHAIEQKLNTQAELILEAINRDDTGLTYRMLRGVIAEAAFEIEVVSKLTEWKDITPDGDLPFDYLLTDGDIKVTVQIKLQRSVDYKPMLASQALKKYSSNMFVVETQKTRAGKNKTTNEDTRPYRFGEFDILAVSMQPSTGNWSDYMYTVSSWLIPSGKDERHISKFQPIAKTSNDDWTDNFFECVKWLKKDVKKTISMN